MKREKNQKSEAGISMENYLNRMDLLEVKLEQIDRKISNKADEVVHIQLLQHRRELEDLYESVSKMESHLKWIDEELSTLLEETQRFSKSVKTKDAKSPSKKVSPLFT